MTTELSPEALAQAPQRDSLTLREQRMLDAFRLVPPVTQDFFYACLRTRWAKNADYAGWKGQPDSAHTMPSRDPVDELANFREGATLVGISMPKVWATYFWKHLTAILSWVKTEKVASEPLWKRCMDVAVYSSLLVLIAMEKGEIAPTKIEDYDAGKDS